MAAEVEAPNAKTCSGDAVTTARALGSTTAGAAGEAWQTSREWMAGGEMKSMGLLCRGRRRSFRRCALRSDLVVARFVRKQGQRGYCGAEIVGVMEWNVEHIWPGEDNV